MTIIRLHFATPFKSAAEHRIDFAQAHDDLSEADRKLTVSRKQRWPDLQLNTRYERFSDDNDGGFTDFDEEQWFIGLSLQSGLGRKKEQASMAQTKLQGQQIRLDAQILQQRVEQSLRAQIRNYALAKKELGLIEQNRELSAKQLELARSLYEMGKSDNLTVNESEKNFFEIETQQLQAQSRRTVNAYRLLYAMGILIEHPAELKRKPDDR